MPGDQRSQPSIIGPVMQLFQAYLGAPTTGRDRRPAHVECGIFQAYRRAQLHDDPR